MAQRILVVDDDAQIARLVRTYLEKSGFAVLTAANGEDALHLIRSEKPDLVVLDLMLPDRDGWEITRIVRRDEALKALPIIMLTARVEDTDRIVGLELGADDYLAKPCSPRELLARVRAVLRRGEDARGPGPLRGKAYYFLGFTLDGVRRQLRAPDGVTILLTAGEFSLLSVFLDNPQRILSRDELIERARGTEADVFDRAIDVQISRLRRKVQDCASGEVIKTYRGAGYLFDAKVTRP